MNILGIPVDFAPRQALERLGYQANGVCYCGCGRATGAFFTPGEDPEFNRQLRELDRETLLDLAIHHLARRNNPPQAPDEHNEAAPLEQAAIALQQAVDAAGKAAEASAVAAEASREAAAACGRAADACGRSADAMERAADALERAANRLAPSAK